MGGGKGVISKATKFNERKVVYGLHLFEESNLESLEEVMMHTFE
jgi:hypothetical protein